MAQVCQICNKKPGVGNHITRRGMAKKKGGAGRKITGIACRSFKPNIQRIKIATEKGTRRIFVCVKCLKAGKVKKAIKTSPRPTANQPSN